LKRLTLPWQVIAKQIPRRVAPAFRLL